MEDEEGKLMGRYPKAERGDILIVSLVVLFCGNLIQVAIWALIFEWLGEFQNYSEAFYHSMVNFTTLGYGDLVMSDAHKLPGAIEAANGVLMFGLTTGFLCSVLNVFIQHAWKDKLVETGLI